MHHSLIDPPKALPDRDHERLRVRRRADGHRVTKQGNRYIRKMLVLGATSLLNVLGKRKGPLRDWIVGLLAKKPARLVTVALANKLARILWAMMKTGECFRTEMFAKA